MTSGTRRMSMTISPMASSTTLRVLLYGALKTATPCDAAAGRSTCSVPMQKQPTASSRSADSSALAVTRVLERMPRMLTPLRARASSASASASLSVSTR